MQYTPTTTEGAHTMFEVDTSRQALRMARYMQQDSKESLQRAVADVADHLERAARDIRNPRYTRLQASNVLRELHHSTSNAEYVATYEHELQRRTMHRRDIVLARYRMGSAARKAQDQAERAAQAAERAEAVATAEARLAANGPKLARAQANLSAATSDAQRKARQRVVRDLERQVNSDLYTVGRKA